MYIYTLTHSGVTSPVMVLAAVVTMVFVQVRVVARRGRAAKDGRGLGRDFIQDTILDSWKCLLCLPTWRVCERQRVCVYWCLFACMYVGSWKCFLRLLTWCVCGRERCVCMCVCVCVGSWKCLLCLPRWCVCARERQREYVYMCVWGFVKVSPSSTDVVCVGETWLAMGRDPQKQNKTSTTLKVTKTQNLISSGRRLLFQNCWYKIPILHFITYHLMGMQ